MNYRRLMIVIVAFALFAWPVLAATSNVYLPLLMRAPSTAGATLTATATSLPLTATVMTKPSSTTTPTSTSLPVTAGATTKPGSTATFTVAPKTMTTTPTATVLALTATATTKPGSTATPTFTAIPPATAAPSATSTPTPLPSSLNACQQDSNASNAPNYPVKITAIDKNAETVTLQNVSAGAIDLAGWTMCSIKGNQTHPIFGTLAPGQSQTFPGPAGNIWNNSEQDDGALYNPNGSLVSYLVCTQVQCH